ncbi:ATP-binding protein [Thalassotalea atypica]|uniref:ATP-binding protein n=1 Tax=Thalassotalea atypica TaxID=2054316 RepID=UPI0025728F6D|nr:ATP-binding protein [Thalassotalea atypica]
MINAQQLYIALNKSDDLKALNAEVMEFEVQWFQTVLTQRLTHYFELDQEFDVSTIVPPNINEHSSAYAQFICQNNLNYCQRLAILLALMPHVKPGVLDTFFIKNTNLERNYTEFGGLQGKAHTGFLPTVETLIFILSGNNMNERFTALHLFDDESTLIKNKVVEINREHKDEPFLSSGLRIGVDYLNLFTTGVVHKPDFSMSFPAKRISTPLAWEELVLNHNVLDEIEQITSWVNFQNTIMGEWELSKNIKPGYRAALYGPPGTGKSLTATLIGKKTGMDVYRIDLSAIVSKYIGETEKNLANVFDQAENKNWILFFDEADALFGKRTGESSSNDRHANQEIAYLLQRTESFPGVIILATNLKCNMDDAFVRRFQSVIYFPMPDETLRAKLWRNIIGDRCRLADDVDIHALAEHYELSGGSIINVVRHAAINVLRNKKELFHQQDFIQGIRKEMLKEGKVIS